MAPGCKTFCLVAFVSKFCSFPLSPSCFSGQVRASLWVGQAWSSSWDHRGKERRALWWRQVVAPDGEEGTLWLGGKDRGKKKLEESRR